MTEEVENVEIENKEETKTSSIEEAKEVLKKITEQNQIMAQKRKR